MSAQLQEARAEGLSTGRREGQQAREGEVQKLKELVAQYRADVERHSRTISNLSGQAESESLAKR